MPQLFKNDARARLATAINDSATTIVVEAGYGDRFPVATMGTGVVGDWFKATLENELGVKEVVKVRTRTAGSDMLADVVRGEEGYAAASWDAGTVIGLRLTADDIQAVLGVDWSAIPEESVTAVSSVKTLTHDCRGQHVDTDSATILVPSGVFSKGDLVVIYNNSGGNRAINAAGGVTMRWDGGVTGNRVLEPYGLCTVFCVASNVFRITGAGVS
jgi:hypothetical protein